MAQSTCIIKINIYTDFVKKNNWKSIFAFSLYENCKEILIFYFMNFGIIILFDFEVLS